MRCDLLLARSSTPGLSRRAAGCRKEAVLREGPAYHRHVAQNPLARWLARLTVRETGEPASGNGASSFHLVWHLPTEPLTSVSAVFQLLVEPSVERLYFFALQATFLDQGRPVGGGHLGLQWHPAYPGNRAVNWGGYGPDGRELEGSAPALPSTLDNPNTRDYAWETGVRYRFRIARSEVGWRGTVTNLDTGGATDVRDLLAGGTHLSGPMVWTEAFCRCEHPPVVARWSDLAAERDGRPVPVAGVRVSYQTHAQGGCSNTTVRPDGDGFLQVTGSGREVDPGTLLPVP